MDAHSTRPQQRVKYNAEKSTQQSQNSAPGGGQARAGSPGKRILSVATSFASCFSSPYLYCGTTQQDRSPCPDRASRMAASSGSAREVERKRTLSRMYTQKDFIRDSLFEVLQTLKLQAPYLPLIVVDYLPLYAWNPKSSSNDINVNLGHSNTISCNKRCLFGVVTGPRLNPNTDHIINLRLDDGIEFGIGVATKENVQKDAKRDFMCEKGGWGYYNYKTKSRGTKPKYPAGWYSEEHDCIMQLPEEDILYVGDIITMTVTRDGVTGGAEEDPFSGPRPGNGLYTVRYFKNGCSMQQEIKGIQGPLYLCLNYYFMSSTVRLLSDHKCSRKNLTAGLHR